MGCELKTSNKMCNSQVGSLTHSFTSPSEYVLKSARHARNRIVYFCRHYPPQELFVEFKSQTPAVRYKVTQQGVTRCLSYGGPQIQPLNLSYFCPLLQPTLTGFYSQSEQQEKGKHFFIVSTPYLRKDFITFRCSRFHHSLLSLPDQFEDRNLLKYTGKAR